MLLFPTDSLRRGQVETDYGAEFLAAQNAGFDVALFDFDALRRGDSAREILRLTPRDGEGKMANGRSLKSATVKFRACLRAI